MSRRSRNASAFPSTQFGAGPAPEACRARSRSAQTSRAGACRTGRQLASEGLLIVGKNNHLQYKMPSRCAGRSPRTYAIRVEILSDAPRQRKSRRRTDTVAVADARRTVFLREWDSGTGSGMVPPVPPFQCRGFPSQSGDLRVSAPVVRGQEHQ